MKTRKKSFILIIGFLLLPYAISANAPNPVASAAPAAAADSNLWDPASASCRQLSAEENTKLGMIRQMIDGNKPHAALAYLEASKLNAPQAEQLKADALRKTGRPTQAAQIYQQLRSSCMSGYAQQGLGLIASEAGKMEESLAALKAASASLPVDASVRNDYGYILMSLGDNQAAIHEFMTAIELDPSNRRTANNLVLALLRKGDQAKASEFASRLGIFPATLAELQILAQQPINQQEKP